MLGAYASVGSHVMHADTDEKELKKKAAEEH